MTPKTKQNPQSGNTNPKPTMRSTGRGQDPRPGDGGHYKKIQGGHPYQTSATLNRDGGYELPAIFNHLLSRD